MNNILRHTLARQQMQRAAAASAPVKPMGGNTGPLPPRPQRK